jgi:hypothetical protein
VPATTPAAWIERTVPKYSEEAYHAIEPLLNFNLAAEEPLKLRPFKPKFHMTMGKTYHSFPSSPPTDQISALENATLSDIVPMDNTYIERVQIRTDLIQRERRGVLACNPRGSPAVLELYEWLTSTYLPRRFPSLFTLVDGGVELRNNVTGSILPLHVTDADEALRIMGCNIDDEFLFMLKSEKPEDEANYRMEAFINCFPNGFSTRSKLGLLLADIHAPVSNSPILVLPVRQRLNSHRCPAISRSWRRAWTGSLRVCRWGSEYSEAQITCETYTDFVHQHFRVVKRANWGISTSGELFCVQGAHMTEEELAELEREEEREEIDLSRAVVRCERQTLHRLPRTGALVFAFKVCLVYAERRGMGSTNEI